MRRDYQRIIIVLLCIFIIFFQGCIELKSFDSSNQTNDSQQTDQTPPSTVSIACWNLQIFGQTKAANDALLSYYAETLDDYDIFIIQEIRDKEGTAIETLANKLSNYSYIISQRAGQTSSKEQYAIFYLPSITLVSTHDYTIEYESEMQRPPYQASFQVNNWTVTLFTIHCDPDDVDHELSIVEQIIGQPTTDTILIGDLNADGSYYDEEHKQHFTDWTWVITDSFDTTVASSNNTYDRIIVNEEALDNFYQVGIMDEVTSEQSDHYLIYAVFDTQHT